MGEKKGVSLPPYPLPEGCADAGECLRSLVQDRIAAWVNVGCFLGGRKVVTRFNDSNWPHYLDAAVAFLGKNGRVRYGYLRSWESKNSFDC